MCVTDFVKAIILILCLSMSFLPVFASHTGNNELPVIHDPNLKIEKFVGDIPNSPTTMTFVGDDILVLERTGHVRVIKDGQLLPTPALGVKVAYDGERGLLGITSVGNAVYLYFTAADENGKAIENRIYKYDWNGTNLINPKLMRTLPSDNFYHNGGAMTNSNGQVYAVIGDNGNYGHLQNRASDDWKNDTSVILRVDPPGPYYAMGIRNSFGITIDPITGNLWDTENGPEDYDEVNFVPENFNSGWIEIMGPTDNQTKIDSLPKYGNFVYKNPEFSWEKTVAPTGIAFGTKQIDQDDKVFVVDCNNGNLYRFTLNSERTGFVFNTPQLNDQIANRGETMDEIILGTGFGCATDVVRGPDGSLYIVSLSQGTIYRISSAVTAQTMLEHGFPTTYVAIVIAGIIAALVTIVLKRRKSI